MRADFSPGGYGPRVLLIVAISLSGCTASSSSATTARAKSGSKGTVGVSVLTLGNPFFRVIGDHITAELKKAGYETVVVSGEMDPALQKQQVDDFLTANVAAIVLCPCNSQAVGRPIMEANKKGVPVFTADIACLAAGAKVVSHIATDNLGGGRQAAEAMIEALGEKGGKVVILDYKDAESCILRVRGFKEIIEKHNRDQGSGKIEIVAELPGDGKTDKGDQAAQDALQAYPDLSGIFAINDPSALGALAALEKAGKAKHVKLAAFDGQPEGKQAIKEGKIYADPIQFPEKMGVEVVKAIVAHSKGQDVPPEMLIPTSLYRKGDAEKDPELK
jgi:ribose transport system substrate-binding protein